MKIKSEKDFWSGLMFVLVGIGFAWGATLYNFGSSARPGPAYFPFGLGALMALMGAFILFKALTFEVEGGDRIGAWAWKPLFIITLAVAGFGFLLPRLGLVISLPLLVVVAAFAGNEFKLREAVINAVVMLVFSWLIFVYGLKLSIPLWPTIFGA